MALLIFLLFTLVISSFSFATAGPQVRLGFGTFEGISNPLTGTDTFYGLPFAAPPIGPLRLRPPQPINVNYGAVVQNASFPKSDCSQQNANVSYPPPVNTMITYSNETGSEDCLYLNIYRPSNVTSSSKLPVIYFLYGSGFSAGGSSVFDGSNIVSQSMAMSQGVIFVAGNYRLSGWGWLPGIEMQQAGLGNLGLRDQRAALEWMQTYIAQFGGDPDRVTIMGESAGAISVALHMAMYGGNSQGLFRAGIMESGSVFPFGPLSNGQDIFDQMVTATNCSSAADKIDCLRCVDSQTYYNAVQSTPATLTTYRGPAGSYIPRMDGLTLTDLPESLFMEGKFDPIPIIIGENQDEGTLWQFTSLNVTTNEGFASFLSSWWPSSSNSTRNALIQAYPQNPALGCPYNDGDLYAFTNESKRIASILGDAIFIAPRRFVSQLYTNASLPVWSYHFTAAAATPYLGAYHGSEVPYVFGETTAPLSTQMRALWIAFANSLDPNSYGSYAGAAGLPYWPQYGAEGKEIEFGATNNTIIIDDYRTEGISIFNGNFTQFVV